MAERKQTVQPTSELDPKLVAIVRQEVRAQVTLALERVLAELRNWAATGSAPSAAPVPGSAPAAAPAPAQQAAGIDRRTIVVLSAAVAAVLRRPARINRITYLNQNTISAWAEAGRMTIHNSHRLGRTL